jgi:predicted nucleic acid-binding protein
MKAFFDTSVLVAAFYGDHVHHEASLAVLTRYSKTEAACGAHSLVEVYSALTRMPGKHRVGGEQALLFIGSIRERLTVVGLTPPEYVTLLESAAAKGITGGTIYDALLAACALKAGAGKLFTWNLRHYSQCGPEVQRILQTP